MKSELIEVIRTCIALERAAHDASSKSAEALAGRNLFEYSTFRLNAREDQNPLIGFGMIKAGIRRGRQPEVNTTWASSEGIIISSSSCDHDNAQKYIRGMSGKNNLTYVIKDRLTFKGAFGLYEWLYWLVFAITQSLRTMSSKRRRNMALTIIEVLEIALVLKRIRQHNIRFIFDFVPFEVDSNMLYVCASKLGVHTTKIPSPGPLSTHNKIVLADALVLSSGYHFDELPTLEKNYIVKEKLMWAPERAHTYYALYANRSLPRHPHTLGFYSHGEWIRKKNGLVKETSTVLVAEEETLGMLGRFLKAHPTFSLTIYPHPKERKGCSAEELHAYYLGIIGAHNFQIATADRGTTFRFDEIDIAVTCYSTIIFERLYCGFKTIIKRIPEHDFPKPLSPLNTTCFENYDEFEALILKDCELDNAGFFERHQLNNYLYTHFPKPILT